ncbi:MAG TPA: AI-2E family transporter [Trueperaceae bacterium]
MPQISYTRRVLTVLGLGTLFLVGLLFAWQVVNVLLLVFAGLLISVILGSIANLFYRNLHLGWRWSLALALLLSILFLGGAGWLIGPGVVRQLSKLGSQISHPAQSVEQTLSQYEWGRRLLEQTPFLEVSPIERDRAGQEQPQAGGGPAAGGQGPPISLGTLMAGVTGIATRIVSIFANVVLVLFVGVFVAVNPWLYQKGLIALFPKSAHARVREVLRELYRTIQGWLFGQLVGMLIIGTLTGVGLWILGMPLVLALAFLAFLLEFVPLIGPWLSAVPAVLIALSQGLNQALWVVVVYIVIQQIESNILVPIIEQRAVSIPPALTLVAVFIMGGLFGFVGIFVAAPLVAIVMVLIKMLYVQGELHEEVELPSDSGD